MFWPCKPPGTGYNWNSLMEARFDTVSERLVNRYLEGHPDALTPDNAMVRDWLDKNGVVAGATAAQAEQIENNTERLGHLEQTANTYFTYVSPEMFGAAGDGAADDTTAIQTAIEKARSLGSFVKFSEKTYCVSSPLEISGVPIDFNHCTLKRVKDGKVLIFNGAENYIVRDVNIVDNGNTYGNAIDGKNCDGIIMENITVKLTSPHVKADGSTSAIGNWAACLSGRRFFIRDIRIDTADCGIWGDGLHIGHLSDSIISDFHINSGDDCIAFEMNEDGGTGFANVTTRNVVVANGVLNSMQASSVRMGFSNSGNRTQDEISDIYCDGVIFHNVFCKSRYFFRYEYIAGDTAVTPASSKNITFSNVKYHNLAPVSKGGYVYFHASPEYSFENWRFHDCDFSVSDEQVDKIHFFSFGDAIKTGDIVFKDCQFNFGKTVGFACLRMDSFTLEGCRVKTNGTALTNDSETDININDCIFTNSAESAVDRIVSTVESTAKPSRKFRFNNVIVNNFSRLVNTKISSVIVSASNIFFNNDMGAYSYVGGEHNYSNIISSNKHLTNSQNMFIYVAANGTYTLDCKKFVYCKITPLGTSTADTEPFLYRIYDGALVAADRTAKTTILSNHGMSVSWSSKVLTITNNTSETVNAIIELYSQTNG